MKEMRNEVSETYSTHPCSRGYATWVAATRVHTQNPNTCKRKAQKGFACCVSGGGGPLAEHPWLTAQLRVRQWAPEPAINSDSRSSIP